jgi:hypothetical protein
MTVDPTRKGALLAVSPSESLLIMLSPRGLLSPNLAQSSPVVANYILARSGAEQVYIVGRLRVSFGLD